MTVVTVVHHRVDDYDAWKKVYDDFETPQREKGVRWHGVYRSRTDAHMVVVAHTFESQEVAEEFFSDRELGDAMMRAGVDMGSVQIEYLDEIASGHLS